MKKDRNFSLDLLRILAFVCLVGVHSFLKSDFYYIEVKGIKMLLCLIIRSFFMVCVPLFIMLTGYFMSYKTLSIKYYKGIVRVVVIYILCSVVCCIFRNLRFSQDCTFWNILSFNASGYAWYVNMYLGLFVLVPFLNALWRGLDNKKQRIVLIATLFAITALPCVVNIFAFDMPGWWQRPSMSAEYKMLIPNWWAGLYPFMYYYLGAYIKEYPAKLKRRYIVLLLILAVLLFGAFSFYRSRGSIFVWGAWQNWGSPFIAAESVLVFLLYDSVKIKKVPKAIGFCVSHIAEWTFGAYLLSYLFDKLFYPVLKAHYPLPEERIPILPVVALVVILCSLIMSGIINTIYDLVHMLIKHIIYKKKRKKESVYAHT